MTERGLGAVELAGAIARGDVGAVEATRACLERIAHEGPGLNAFLHVDAEGALAQAAAVDMARARGETLGPLAGVPVALKDNLCVRGLPATCASKILEGWISPYDAHVVERLRQAGAVLVAKTNMDEFAMGSSNENSAFGPVKNPWDATRAPGGSSGGSAASVAAGLVPLALGSDTGGSVRQPGSFCGLVAFKPTYGRVSRWGLIAFASSLDQIGPFGRSVRDVARIMELIAIPDERDATCVGRSVPQYEALLDGASSGSSIPSSPPSPSEHTLKGVKVGVVRAALEQRGVETGVRAAVEKAIETLRGLGAQISEVSLPHADHAVSAYYLIAPAECSSNLARFDGMRYGLRVTGKDLTATYGETRAQGFGPEVKRRIMLGTYALSAGYYDAFYVKAQKVRTLIARDYEAAFATCDFVLSPTSPTVAFALGAKSSDPLAMYLADVFTLPPSLAGLPAISVPCGFSDGLPVGLQLTGRAFDEGGVLRVAHAYEQAAGFAEKRAFS